MTSPRTDREKYVVRYALERHARETPDRPYAIFEDRTVWSFQETLGRVQARAAALRAAGARQHDRVLVMLPNGPCGLEMLLAINYLGGIFVPVNPALRGGILAHLVENSGAQIAVVDENGIEALDDVAAPQLTTILYVGDTQQSARLRRTVMLHSLVQETHGICELETPIEPWHTQSIIYTSGTTGRSKGVVSSYIHSLTAVGPETWTCTRAGDRHLLHMPIFHIGGAFLASACLCVGSSVAVVAGFKTQTFWKTVTDLRVDVVFLLGAMATFLLKAPPNPEDRDHRLRAVFIVPLGQSGATFHDRFGVDVYTLFNMTEISTPLLSDRNPTKAGTCGRVRAGVDVRLVDENDLEVPLGSVGQMIIRADAPWTMNGGYHANPDATAVAWRNGWFHTGDAFSRDKDGDFFFVDRLKDTIRRRGENISSFEIEVELLAHPDIREAAAIPVPSPFTEDDVLAVLSPVEGRVIDPAQIIDFLTPRVARFMLPRYIRVMDELPKTPTEKTQKHTLRSEGVTSDTWDRDYPDRTVTPVKDLA